MLIIAEGFLQKQHIIILPVFQKINNYEVMLRNLDQRNKLDTLINVLLLEQSSKYMYITKSNTCIPFIHSCRFLDEKYILLYYSDP